DPRGLPPAVDALTDREAQIPALECVAALGGPAQGEVVADRAKRSPTAEVLPLAVRILTDWGRRPGLSEVERLRRGRAGAEVQGTAGLPVRWQVLGPVSGASADAIIARPNWPGRPFKPPAGDSSGWRTLFATDAEGRLRVQDGAGAAPGPVCLGVTDFILP